MGYAGGATDHPTYHDLGGHTETLEMDYDPSAVSYDMLLDVFFDEHVPNRPPWSRQYASIIFVRDVQERARAEAAKARAEKRLGMRLYTEITDFERFWPAEDYHQKYSLRNAPTLLGDLTRAYPEADALRDSTAAARLNGFAGGNGSGDQARRLMDDLGLSEQGRKRLEEMARRLPDMGHPGCPVS